MASLKEGTENQSYEPVTDYSNVPVVPEYPNPYDNETTPTTNKLNEVPTSPQVNVNSEACAPSYTASEFDLNSRNPNENKQDFVKIPYLTEDEAKEALALYVSQHCCFGKGPLKTMEFNNIQSCDAYRYNLQTFTESRSTIDAKEPYHGAAIYITGSPPAPWDIACTPKGLFQNEIVYIEIPNTSHVETCRTCNGCGRVTCQSCSGSGRVKCSTCSGHGHKTNNQTHERESCNNCHSSGKIKCHNCDFTGRVMCHECKGSGKMRWYRKLVVEFQNKISDYIKQESSLEDFIPEEDVRKCQSHNVFSEQNLRLYPICHHPVTEINEASYRLLEGHDRQFKHSKILVQRHDVTVIPITTCFYTWKGQIHNFKVYGMDRLIWAPKYPVKCCWGCSIL